jgi:hypothetical protein
VLNLARTKNDVKRVKDFWQSVMEDEEINIQHRLKASELCIKLSSETVNENQVIIISGEQEIED